MTRSICSLLVAAFAVAALPGRLTRAGELAERRGVESHWKRSGRTYRALDYPYSPERATYGGAWPRRWGNRGFLFIAPIEEIPPWDLLPPEEVPPRPEEALEREELLARLELEEALREQLEERIAALETDLDAQTILAEEEAIRRMRAETQMEEMEEWALDPERIPRKPVDVDLVPAKTDLYLVRPGDTLWTVAGRPEVYNDSYKWMLLYHANRDQIFHPDWIYPNMVLLVPRYPGLETPGPEAPPAEPGLGEEE